MKELIEEGICPVCGGEINHWSQGIYECNDCETMIPLDDDDDED